MRPDYGRIAVPAMIVAGWSDLYRNAALRFYEHLSVPRRPLFGPWSHMSPRESIPGPRIDFCAEMIRWFDRWLRDRDTGIDAEPPVVVYVRRSSPPDPALGEARGEWRYEPGWPPARARPLALELGQPPPVSLPVRGDVGVTAHIRGNYPPPYGLPVDQRRDHAHSLVFDWPVDREIEILGNSEARLAASSTHRVAHLSVKLCEVLADGTAVLVTRGLLNLTHRESDRDPEPLEPGRVYDVRVDLDATSWVFEPGSRIRLAVAGADWPSGWPPPEASTLTVDPGRSVLTLPELVGPAPVAAVPRFGPGDPPDPDAAAGASWTITDDVYARRTRVLVESTGDAEVRPGVRVRRLDRVETGVDRWRRARRGPSPSAKRRSPGRR